MTNVVVDASVVLAWFLRDEQNTYADAILTSANSVSFLVPQHWTLEIANVFALAENVGRLTASDVAGALNTLGSLQIEVDSETYSSAFGMTLSLCRRHRITAYYAAYLELALRKGAGLASLDRKLVAAAAAEGVTLFQP